MESLGNGNMNHESKAARGCGPGETATAQVWRLKQSHKRPVI